MLAHSKIKKLIRTVGSHFTFPAMAASSSTPDGDHFYYFAFGSNLLRERVSINSPSALFVTTAKLEGLFYKVHLSLDVRFLVPECFRPQHYPLSPYLGYRLGFGNHSKVMESRWGGSPANIFPVSSDSPCPVPGAPPYVWGTVWRIHSDHLPALDAQEGVRAGSYEPVIVNTIPADGTLGHELTCRCYQVFIIEL